MFEKFAKLVQGKVEGEAKGKGYRLEDEKDGRPGGELYTFVGGVAVGHPIGEIIYKAVRFRKKQDPDDLIKIAAWAYLIWSRAQPSDIKVGYTEEGHGFIQRETIEIPKADRRDAVRPILDKIPAVHSMVLQELERALKIHSIPDKGDLVRLCALVAEESGEAMKCALNATRPETVGTLAAYSGMYRKDMRKELVQTAAMALIALAVTEG